jgi:hypothetical protein
VVGLTLLLLLHSVVIGLAAIYYIVTYLRQLILSSFHSHPSAPPVSLILRYPPRTGWTHAMIDAWPSSFALELAGRRTCILAPVAHVAADVVAVEGCTHYDVWKLS